MEVCLTVGRFQETKEVFFDHTVRLTDMSPNFVSSVSLHNRLLQSYHLSLYAVYQKERIMGFIPFVFKDLMPFAGNIGLREKTQKKIHFEQGGFTNMYTTQKRNVLQNFVDRRNNENIFFKCSSQD